ncbi:MAG: LptF/LptG family permease [Candidatus Puniceispirillaceae bacterium]
MNILPPLVLSLYFSKRYLGWILLTLAALLSFVMLIDAVELYRRFSNASTDQSGVIIIWLLVMGLPEKIDLLLPFTILFGSILCFQNWAKTNEITVARGFGQNIWQALLPVFLTVMVIGSVQNLVLNPFKSATIETKNELQGSIFGKQDQGKLSISASGVWLKDISSSDELIIHGPSLSLTDYRINRPIIYSLNQQGGIIWRIRASSMTLTDKGWLVEDAAKSDNLGTTTLPTQLTLSTSMKPIDFARTTQSPETISIYALPGFIAMLNQTGLPSTEHRVYFQQQLSNPIRLLGLSMLAACFTLLRFSRMPRYKLMALGIGLGFAVYFFTDLVFLLGANARLPVIIAGWGPAFAICFVAGFLLARSED